MDNLVIIIIFKMNLERTELFLLKDVGLKDLNSIYIFTYICTHTYIIIKIKRSQEHYKRKGILYLISICTD